MKATLETRHLDSLVVAQQTRERFDQEGIAALAQSIAETGLQQPLLARIEQGRAVLIDGERRLRAVRELGWAEVPVLVLRDPLSIAEAVARQLACNLQRADLNAVERAKGIRLLMKEGNMSAEDAGRKVGLTPGQVTKALSVLRLPEHLQIELVSGTLAADSAYQLSRVEDPGEQAALAAQVLSNRLTRDALTRKLKSARRGDDRRAAGIGRCTVLLGEGRSLTAVGKSLTLDALVTWLELALSRARKAKAQGLSLETLARAMRDQARTGKGAPA